MGLASALSDLDFRSLSELSEPVVVGLAARVGERDDILKQIGLIQETPPAEARRTPPPEEE